MALNITDGVDGVLVESMAQQQTGCLHDFQMTTADMKKALPHYIRKETLTLHRCISRMK